MTSDEILIDYRVNIAASIALIVGLIQFVVGILGLGFIASYFSDSFISAYFCGSAFHIIFSQLKDLLD